MGEVLDIPTGFGNMLTKEQKKRLKRLRRRKKAGKSINEARLEKLQGLRQGIPWSGPSTKGLGKEDQAGADETEDNAWVPKGVKEERQAGVDDIVSAWDWLSSQPGFFDLPIEVQKAMWQKLKHNDATWPFSAYGPEGERGSDKLFLEMLAKAGLKLGMSAEELSQLVSEDWAVFENAWGGTGPTWGRDPLAYFNPESTLYDPEKGQMIYGISEDAYNLMWDMMTAWAEANPDLTSPEAWRGPEGAMGDYIWEQSKAKAKEARAAGATDVGGGGSGGNWSPSGPSNMEVQNPAQYVVNQSAIPGALTTASPRRAPGPDGRFPQGFSAPTNYMTNRTQNNNLPSPVSGVGGNQGLGPLSWRSSGRRRRWL